MVSHAFGMIDIRIEGTLFNYTSFLAQVADTTANAAAASETAEEVPGFADAIEDLTTVSDNPVINLILDYAVSIVGALVLLLIGLALAKQLKKVSSKASVRAMHDDGTSPLPRFIGNVVYYIVLVVVVLTCLSIFGIETTSFAAILAAAGLAIGLAFQGTLSNLAAGVMLIVFRPFKLGDFITGGGSTGIVREIGLFTTTLVTTDNRVITIPNSALSGTTIDNCTQDYRRVDIDIAVPYSYDLASVRSALERAMNIEGGILSDDLGHQSSVYLNSTTPGGTTNYSVRVWCKGEDYWTVRERLTAQCKIEVDKNGVSITSKGIRRADVDVTVPYESDLDSVRAALVRAMNVEGAILDDGAGHASGVVLLSATPGGTANYQVRVWCEGDKYWSVKEAVTIQSKIEIDRNGASITSKNIRRVDVNVGVAYEADLDKTRAALEKALKVEGALSEPAPAVVLIDLGDSSVNYQLRVWCNGDHYWTVREALTANAKRELDRANIEIPFPQVTISNK